MRGEYTMAVKHEVINQGTTTLTPQLYLQLARDGNAPEGESSFYFTFTGPAVYTDAKKFQKIEFKDIAKNNTSHEKAGDNGWVAMVQHYFASAWLVQTPGAREFRTTKVADNLYTIAMVMPMGEVAPGASRSPSPVQDPAPRRPACFLPAGRRTTWTRGPCSHLAPPHPSA